jgi:amidase
VQLTENIRLPLRPMIGVIGVAPANDSIDTFTPGEHGGNMDCKEIIEGSTIYLPVNVPGALLAIGDLHALMGDGEVLICGLECPGTVKIRVNVVKNAKIPTPMVVNDGKAAFIASKATLEEASVAASRGMQGLLMQSGLDAAEAGRLLSLVGDLAICQIVDPLMTVRMSVALSVLTQAGVKLP